MRECMRRVVVNSPSEGAAGFEGWFHKWSAAPGGLDGIVERDDGQAFLVRSGLIRFKDSPAEKTTEKVETRNERIWRLRNER